MSYRIVLGYARKMRKNQTEAEQFFWEKVRRKNFLGLKITRQFMICHMDEDGKERFYIADFHCHSKKLIIEIDGGYHGLEAQKMFDEMREEKLKEMGYHVIRFKNQDVLTDWDTVERVLTDFVEGL